MYPEIGIDTNIIIVYMSWVELLYVYTYKISKFLFNGYNDFA